MTAHKLKYALRVVGATAEREEMMWIEEAAEREESDAEADTDLYNRTLSMASTLKSLIRKAKDLIENDPFFK